MIPPNDAGGSQNARRVSIGDRSPALAAVAAVAQFTDEDPLSLPPLANVIDPEALDQFVASTEDGKVQFSYTGVDVEISGGEIFVAERPG